MARQFYGSLTNRLEENRMFCKEIKVGTGMTEYLWSDCHAYEVVEVIDQKHVKVREYDHKHVGEGSMDNCWNLVSNPNNPVYLITKRGNYWYWTTSVTDKILEGFESKSAEEQMRIELALLNCGVSIATLREKKKVTKLSRANVSFGVAQYYYDYSF